MKVLDLFSGIGGFSLGLEAASFRTVAFCEILPFPRRVLAHHWPGVPIYDDVRTLSGDRLVAAGIDVDVICGGFPCQDVSNAGSRDGIDGARSRLWEEFARLIREIRPAYVIVENTAALLSRGMGRVLGDLAALGFDAEWHCIPASAVGAPHVRDRIWIIAYPDGDGRRCEGFGIPAIDREQGAFRDQPDGLGSRRRRGGTNDVPDADGLELRDDEQRQTRRRHDIPDGRDTFARHDGAAWPLADAEGDLWRTGQREGVEVADGVQPDHGRPEMADADRPRLEIVFTGGEGELEAALGAHPWAFEPDVGRMAHGVSARMDKLAALGNAVVPQIPYLIGRAILAYEARDGQ